MFSEALGFSLPSLLVNPALGQDNYTPGIKLKRVTSAGAYLRAWVAQLRRNVAAMASRWRHCGRF